MVGGKLYPLRAAALILCGRSWCSFQEAMAGRKNREAQLRLKAELAKSLRMVKEDGEFVLWETNGEQYWLPRASRILPGMLAEQRLGVYNLAGEGPRQNDLVFDCGASIGLYTLQALVRGASKVIAIEPSPRNFECLRRNLGVPVREGRVVLVAKGVWDAEQCRTIRMQPANSAADSLALNYRGSIAGPQVPLTTIDLLVRELELDRVDYIKMDIEGAEGAALKGAAATIRRFRPRMVIAMEHRFADPREIPKIISEIASEYRIRRGPCVDTGHALRPATLYFH